ncbi:hypothetical protein JCM3770_001533 [Rhodotorula araucariae]
MAKVRRYRRYTRDATQDGLSATASTSRVDALLLEDASDSSTLKRRRISNKPPRSMAGDDTTQCTPITSSSSLLELVAAAPAAPVPSSTAPSSSIAPANPPPPLSLATLPLDILERIGELLIPVFVPAKPHGVRSTSQDWIDPAADLARFSSTCKAAWVAARPLVGRVYGCDVRPDGLTTVPDALMAQMRLQHRLESVLDSNAAATHGEVPYHVHANKIRHFYLAWGTPDALALPREFDTRRETVSMTSTANLLATKLAAMTRLETLALVWYDEMTVTASSPYSVFPLPAEIYLGIATHPTLRELYLCGMKITRRCVDNAVLEDVPLLPRQLHSITLNACHDSALELVTLAPGATKVRVHRDFCATPRITPDCFWEADVWRCVEEVEMVGFSGVQGVPLLHHWRRELEVLRSLTPPAFIPLRTLRLCEPFVFSDVRTTLLPALAHLPQLRHFTMFVWHSRDFGPALLADVHDAMPELEELGIALDSEALAWWPGSLSAYAAPLARFRSLRTFTWNYSPYADLTPTSMRSYTLPLVGRSLLPPLRALEQLRWFGEEVYCRPLDADRPEGRRGEWAWSDDPRVRPVADGWMRDALMQAPTAKADARIQEGDAEREEVDENEDDADPPPAAARADHDPFAPVPLQAPPRSHISDTGASLSARGDDPAGDYISSGHPSGAVAASARDGSPGAEEHEDGEVEAAAAAEEEVQKEDDGDDEASSESAGAFDPVGARERPRPRRSMLERLVAARAEEAGAAAVSASAKGKGKARAVQGAAQDAAVW